MQEAALFCQTDFGLKINQKKKMEYRIYNGDHISPYVNLFKIHSGFAFYQIMLW